MSDKQGYAPRWLLKDVEENGMGVVVGGWSLIVYILVLVVFGSFKLIELFLGVFK